MGQTSPIISIFDALVQTLPKVETTEDPLLLLASLLGALLILYLINWSIVFSTFIFFWTAATFVKKKKSSPT